MEPLQIARKVLQDMVRDQVDPTPENYKTYYDRIAGNTPVKRTEAPKADGGSQALQAIRHRIPADPAAQRWKKAVDQALLKNDWYDMEVLIVRAMQTTVELAHQKEAEKDQPKVDHSRLFGGLVHVVESFLRNLTKLFPSNPAVIAQVDVMQSLLEKPDDAERQVLVKRALNKLRVPENLDSRIQEEKAAAKELAHQFLNQMNSAGKEAGSLADSMAQHLNELSTATDQATLVKVTKAMVAATSATHQRLAATSQVLQRMAQRVEASEQKLNQLENEVTRAAEASRSSFAQELLGRRGITAQIEKVFHEHWQYISIAVLNLDNYRQVLTQQGSEHIETALTHFAHLVEAQIQGRGMAARLSDDEFVLVFPGYDAQTIKGEMVAMQRALTKALFLENKALGVVTFSAGVSQRSDDEEPFDDVLTRAEDAMCVAQARGKNCVEVAAHP